MKPLAHLRTEHSREVGLSVVLALQGSIMFVFGPLAATGYIPPVALDLLRLGVAATAVILVTRNRGAAIAIIATFLASTALTLSLQGGAGSAVAGALRTLTTSAFDVAVGAAVANVAFAPGRVTVHRIMGAVILYLSIALVFGSAYRACALFLHPAFNGVTGKSGGGVSQLLYFSLTTITTTGYGDITPVHPFVRSLANLEAVIGQLFPATLLARLVTLHAAHAEDEPKRPRVTREGLPPQSATL